MEERERVGCKKRLAAQTHSMLHTRTSSCPTHPHTLAVSNWKVHCPTRSPSHKKVAEKDFISLNKSAVQSGLTTAQEQAQFRATHDIRRRDDPERRSSRSSTKFPPNMVFGISTRCVGVYVVSFPVHSSPVMCNHMFPPPTPADLQLLYLNSWSTATRKDGYRNKERRSRNREKKSVERFAVTHVLDYIPFHLTNPSSLPLYLFPPSPQLLLLLHQKLQGKVYETRASLMRRYSEPVEPPPLWKMQRWSKVLLLGSSPVPSP